MATNRLPDPSLLRTAGVVFRKQRILLCQYHCRACDMQWSDELLVGGPSWCPACEVKLPPYRTEAFYAERPEFDLDEAPP
jgi:hypothetical protein